MPPALADYGDYVTWQHGVTDGPAGRALLDFWTDKLRGIDPAGLPGDGAAAGPALTGSASTGSTSTESASTESASHLFDIPAADTARLRTLCRVQRVTIATTLLAMVDLFLHRTAGIEDIVIGVPVSHRRRYEFEHVVGQFTNLVIIRTTVTSRMGFAEVLQRVRTAAAEAYQYQDLPYGYLARRLGGDRSQPLYRVVFNFNRAEPPPASPPPQALPLVLPPPHAFADFTIQVHDRSHELGCRFVYKADLFTPARAAELARRFQTLVTELLDRAAVTAPVAAPATAPAREKRA
jgi:non-ribosomal peptide synthetase component F